MFDLSPLHAIPLQQSATFADALRVYGATVSDLGGYLTLHRRIAGLPVTMIPRFACADPAALTGALPPHPVFLSPDAPCPGLAAAGALPLARARRTAHLALSPDRDAMRRAMQGKWRNRLRHGERQTLRVSVRPMPPDPDHWLLRAEEEQARARGYRGWPKALSCAWAAVAPDRTLLIEAVEQGEPVAAQLFLLHGTGASYHIGITTARGRALSAHNLLLWTAMQRLPQDGVAQIDLGLLCGRTPGHNRFKLGSGAVVHDLGGTWLWWRPLSRLWARRPGRDPPRD